MPTATHNRQTGASMVEYIIVLIVIGLAVVSVVRYFGGKVGSRYDCAAARIGALQVADNQPGATTGCDGARPSATPTPAGRFDNPTMGGLPLDHCLRFGTGCGKPAADAFCRAKGYSRADAYGEGLVASTRTANNDLCDISFAPTRGPFCGRFTYVNCG